jgi:hypothetical protein
MVSQGEKLPLSLEIAMVFKPKLKICLWNLEFPEMTPKKRMQEGSIDLT